jgi:exodeoxyribonuclease V
VSHLHLVKSVDPEPFFDAVGNVVVNDVVEHSTEAALFPASPPTPPTPLERLRAALDRESEVVLAGCAGTGKTWHVQHLLDQPGVLLCAPTAKAAGRLKEVTGRRATTVHRLIYGAPVTQWVKADGQVCQGWQDAQGKKYTHGCPGCACAERLVFALPDEKEEEADEVSLIVVDEASMVDRRMADDLRTAAARVGAKLLWVGDPAQLPPVGGDPGVNFLSPDVLLDHVYRAQGGILELATRIRNAISFADLRAALNASYPDVEIRTDGADGLASWRAERSKRMAIVHTNRQRIEANAFVRQCLGRDGPLVRGDRLIVRKNTQAIPVWNGEVYVVQSVERAERFTVVQARLDGVADAPLISFVVDERYLSEPDSQQFGRDAYTLRDAFRPLAAVRHGEDCDIFDFDAGTSCPESCRPGPLAGLYLVNAQHGFVITCHASQGSEADEVGVLWTPRTHRDQLAEARSWLYTAVTRAKKSLTIWTAG